MTCKQDTRQGSTLHLLKPPITKTLKQHDKKTKHILIFVGALYALGLGSFLLWVGELGLSRYPNRTLLKGPSVYKTSIQKKDNR